MNGDVTSGNSGALVFAAILPHGPDLILENAKDPARMAPTRAVMEDAGRRFAAARVDTLILLEPEIIHTLQGIALRDSCSFFAGEPVLSIGMFAYAGGPAGCISERFACDMPLARAILDAGRRGGFPVAGAAGEEDDQRLRGGALVPLWFTLHPLPLPRPGLVVISPSPTVPRDTLLRFGALLADVIRQSGKRVALIASADQGHTHDRNNPRFGFSPAAARHDALYCKAVAENRLDALLDISDELIGQAWADSLWQTLILAGALRTTRMAVNFLSYAVPTYYGMAVAVYE